MDEVFFTQCEVSPGLPYAVQKNGHRAMKCHVRDLPYFPRGFVPVSCSNARSPISGSRELSCSKEPNTSSTAALEGGAVTTSLALPTVRLNVTELLLKLVSPLYVILIV